MIWQSTHIQMYVMKEMNTMTENESSKCFQGLCEHYNKCITFLMQLLGRNMLNIITRASPLLYFGIITFLLLCKVCNIPKILYLHFI
jgi:hypothetical protein